MSNQPIEEKWKEELSYLCDSWDYNYDRLESFIENLLEQERNRMSEEIEKRKMDGYCKDENCSEDWTQLSHVLILME